VRGRGGKRQQERARSLEVSRSRSSSYSYSRSPPPKVVVKTVARVKRNLGGLGGFDAAPGEEGKTLLDGEGPNAALVETAKPTGGRQVGTRGPWAEYAINDGRSYYVHISTGESTWSRPAGYDTSASRRGSTNNVPGAPGTEPQTGHSNLFVGNLPANLDEVSFRALFQQYGAVVSTKVVNGFGYGFVKYSNVTEAAFVQKRMHGAVYNGMQLCVRFAKQDTPVR